MRMRGLMAMGALVMGAVGCGEVVGPPAGAGRDLEFFAPPMRSTATATGFRSWNEPVSRADSMQLQRLSGGNTAAVSAQIPLISRTFVAGEWTGKTYKLSYGMFGGGTGYSMWPQVRIVDARGVAVLDKGGRGLTENAPLYWYMRPTAEEPFEVAFDCGGFADANVLFESRLTGYGLTPTLLSIQKYDHATTHQQPCMPPPQQGGGGQPPSGTVITICNYEAWVDAWGNVIAVLDYGCSSFSGPAIA